MASEYYSKVNDAALANPDAWVPALIEEATKRLRIKVKAQEETIEELKETIGGARTALITQANTIAELEAQITVARAALAA